MLRTRLTDSELYLRVDVSIPSFEPHSGDGIRTSQRLTECAPRRSHQHTGHSGRQ